MTFEDLAAQGGYDAAVGHLERSVDDHDSGAARRELGVLYYMDDRFEEALRQWEIGFRLLRDEGHQREAARLAIDIASLHVSSAGRLAAGRGWIERARMLLEGVGPCVEWGYLEVAAMACDRTDAVDLLASAERALAIAVEFRDIDLEARALADLGLAMVTQGRIDEGLARLDAAMAAISAGEVSPQVAGICFCSMLTACDRVGDLRRAQEWTAVADESVRAYDDRPRALYAHCRLAYGSVLRAAGRWPEAEELMVAALGSEGARIVSHRPLTSAHLASLRVEQGRIEEAAALIEPFEEWVSSCAPLAEIHLARGDAAMAVAVLERGLRELVDDALRIAPLLDLLVAARVRLGDLDGAQAAQEQLAALADRVELPLLRGEALLAAARVAVARGDDPGAIDRFQNALTVLGADARPALAATVRLELAEALARAGRETAAITEARAALSCFERLGAAPRRDRTAALLRKLGDTSRARSSDDSAVELTPREREVLDLLRNGLSNAQIGARLFISAKTAEHHVGRVLTKLGVRTRGEAAALAVRMSAGTPMQK